MRTDLLRVTDALSAIRRIEERATSGRDAFDRDELVQVWCLYHLAIIGEALRAMSPEFQAEHSAIDWQGWTGLRNIVVHQYFRIHPDRIWDTVEHGLPVLKAHLLRLQAEAI